MENLVLKHERLDDLHRDGLMLIQNPERFCFGTDAVLLSNFAKARKGEAVCDLCTGTGVIPILMSAKTEAKSFVGLEIQEDCADAASRSVLYNKLDKRITIICGDLRNCGEQLPSAAFDVVTCNPPYMNEGGGIANGVTPKTIARHELLCTFNDVAATSARLLKFSGRLYLIHRPHRLTDIFCTLRANKLEPKTLRLVQPYAGSEPNLALIEAVRGGRPMLKLLPALTVYKDNGEYTDEIRTIYYGNE